MLCLLLVPLLPGLLWCLWAFWRERELRLALVACFLGVMIVRQLVNVPPSGAGFGELALQQRLAPVLLDLLANILASLAAIAIGRSIVERNRAEQIHWNAMEAFRSLADVFNAERGSFEESLDELLAIGCKHLASDIGLLSRVDGEDYEICALRAPAEIPIARGDRMPLGDTFCSQTVGRDQLLALERTTSGVWAEHPGRQRLGFASYLGAPVRTGNRIVGTLCFAGMEPRRRRFSGSEKQLLDMMARWVGSALTQRQAWEGLSDFARRQQTSLELSRHALHASNAELLQESVTRIASALDVPFVAVLEASADASQPGGGDDLAITASVGWTEGARESRTAIADTLLAPTLANGETVAIADLASGRHAKRPAFFGSHEIASVACLPIAGAEQAIGALCIASAEVREFGEDELDFLHLSTNLLASARATRSNVALSEATPQDDSQASQSEGQPRSLRRASQRDNAPDRRRVGVDAAVGELETAMRGALDPKVSLVLDLAAMNADVRMFRYEFERVLWGLVLRIAELASDSAELRVETALVGGLAEAGAVGLESNDFVTLGVTLRGTELDNEALSKLLDGEEAPGARTREAPTGMRRLPLPRIRRLLRAVGGDISAHSGEREGTTLTAYLPARSQRDTRRQRVAQQPAQASP
jgi:GAF domain-containing protein